MIKLLLLMLWCPFHPVHESLTSIEYNFENKEVNVFIKLSFNDFILDLKSNGVSIKKEIFSISNQESVKILENYINEKLTIEADDKILSGKMKEITTDDYDLSISLVYTVVKRPETISVKNLILTNMFIDQKNFIIVKVADLEEAITLTTGHTEQTFKIKLP